MTQTLPPATKLPLASLEVRGQAECLAQLFDLLPDIFLFVKNAEHQFVRCNRAFYCLHGFQREEQMLGKCDADFHPTKLANAYVEEDCRVMRTGRSIRNAVWLVTTSTSARWYFSTKLPVTSQDNQVIGVAGILTPYEGSGELPSGYERVKPALELADQQFALGIKVTDLASEIGISTNQLTRIFRDLFRMTPGEYLLRLKLDCAARLLRCSGKPITSIALESGFYDHSAFTKQFRKRNGVSPKEYRRRFGDSDGNAS